MGFGQTRVTFIPTSGEAVDLTPFVDVTLWEQVRQRSQHRDNLLHWFCTACCPPPHRPGYVSLCGGVSFSGGAGGPRATQKCVVCLDPEMVCGTCGQRR